MGLALTLIKQRAAQSEQQFLDAQSPIDLGAFNLVLDQTNKPGSLITPSVRAAVGKSWGEDAKILQFKGKRGTIETVRSKTITANTADSKYATITHNYIGVAFEVPESAFYNIDQTPLNDVDRQMYVAEQMRVNMDQFLEYLEAHFIEQIDGMKTKVFANPLDYAITADTIVATNAQRETIISDIREIMRANNFGAEFLDILGDQGTSVIFNRLSENGAQQAENKAMRLANKQLWTTNFMPSVAGKVAHFYAVGRSAKSGAAIGIVPFVAPINALGFKDDSEGWMFETMPGNAWGLPYQLELMSRSISGDTSAVTGNARDLVGGTTQIKIGFAWATIVAEVTDDTVTPLPVIEVVINSAAADADNTAIAVDTVTSVAKTAVTVAFTEQICTDAAGTLAVAGADIKAKFGLTVATPGASITSAIVSSDQTEVVFTIVATNLAAADKLKTVATLYDSAGNALAPGDIAKVNVGNTAWEAI